MFMQNIVHGKLVGSDSPSPFRMAFPAQMSLYVFPALNPSIYVFPCVTTAKACLTSLLATATTATFPGFPFERKRSKQALHSALHLSEEQAAT